MDHQTPHMNGKNRNGAAEPLGGIIGDMGHHFATLVELQLQLLSADMKEATAAAMAPVRAGIIFGILGLSATTILLFGIAALINQYTTLMLGWSLVIVAVAALIIGAAILMAAVQKAKHAPKAFDRSRQELINNIRALNTMWRHPTTARETTSVH